MTDRFVPEQYRHLDQLRHDQRRLLRAFADHRMRDVELRIPDGGLPADPDAEVRLRQLAEDQLSPAARQHLEAMLDWRTIGTTVRAIEAVLGHGLGPMFAPLDVYDEHLRAARRRQPELPPDFSESPHAEVLAFVTLAIAADLVSDDRIRDPRLPPPEPR